jgi:FKBP-type peptidyl-prolyl cis-trans isomerase
MKKILFAFFLLGTFSTYAQKKPVPAKKPATKLPAAKSPGNNLLKTLNDSASYAVGVSVANFYVQQGMKNLNTEIVARAINDAMSGKKTLLTDADANTVLMQYMQKAQTSKAQPNIEAGEKFLAQNKNKPGIKTTASGLQYEVVTQGTGIKPTANDTVVAHYAGKLIDGTEFDNSYKRGQPITIPASSVIKGWTEALQLMPIGSKYRLYIPYQLGYGLNEAGAIPPGSVLIFDVELLDVKKAQ